MSTALSPSYPPRGLPNALRSRFLGPSGPRLSRALHRSGVPRLFTNHLPNDFEPFDVRQHPPPGGAIRRLGRPRKLTATNEEAVLDLLLREGWLYQDEIVFWLWCEREVLVHRSTVVWALKRRKRTQRELRRISLARSNDLRRQWREEMYRYVAQDLVFLDESIFNEKTG